MFVTQKALVGDQGNTIRRPARCTRHAMFVPEGYRRFVVTVARSESAFSHRASARPERKIFVASSKHQNRLTHRHSGTDALHSDA